MPRTDFGIAGWGTRSNITLEADKISSAGGPECPRLTLPLEFSLQPAISETGMIKAYSLLWLKAKLQLGDMKISEGVSDPIAEYSWLPARSYTVHLELPLDLRRIEAIEARRRGDIQLQLLGSALVAEHPPVPQAVAGQRQEIRREVEAFGTGSFTLTFVIPRSHWTEKVLKGLGYGTIQIFEIPIPREVMPEVFSSVPEELAKAQSYFEQGDYDKAVAHSRSALDPLQKVLPEIRTRMTDSKYEWLSEVTGATYNWLDKLVKKTREISSAAHHAPSIGHFSRGEALSILMVTFATVHATARVVKDISQP